MTTKQYTVDDVEELLKTIQTLEGEVALRQTADHDAEVEALKAAHAAEKVDLEGRLDLAVAEAAGLRADLTNTLAYLAAEAASAEAREAAKARKDERVAEVSKLGLFDADFIAERADAWSALDEDTFGERLAEWAAAASKITRDPEGEDDEDDVRQPVLRETASKRSVSARSIIGRLQAEGIDARLVKN